MQNDERTSISITLSPAQIDAVVRAASDSRAPSLSTLIADVLSTPMALQAAGGEDDPDGEQEPSPAPRSRYIPADTDDPRLSRSLLRGLSLLSLFASREEERGIVELADDLGLSPSTAHRYALTLVELGLLERCPTTRKYRLPDA